ncbi:PAS domain S-box protein [uncultured Brevundimonas sp.]|uniref:PAS domain S-box protein n=1 Tax=uncultured Brevundimonas sp. TaxID=213418 RepID=UPI0030ED1B21|tara:strand:+ start:4136 stop:7327 length:3192 start_codon:yes stop_codon:yes gene_type:complete
MSVTTLLKRIVDTDSGIARMARLRPQPGWVNTLIGLGSMLAMLGVWSTITIVSGHQTGMLILLPAVILAALAGGRTAGFVATAVALAGGWTLLRLQGVEVDLIRSAGPVAPVDFVIVALFSTVVTAALRKTLLRLDATFEDLRTARALGGDPESRLEIINEHAPVMLWMSDTKGRCVHLNRAQREFWNVTGEVETFDVIETVHPDDRDRVRQAATDAFRLQVPFETEARFRRYDGSWRTLLTQARPHHHSDGTFQGMIGVNVDVTEHRQIEAALRESESRFRLMADKAPSPVWLTNATGEVEFVNQALVEFYGRPADQILGGVWRETVHPDDLAEVAAHQDAARPYRLPYGFEARFADANGDWCWMRVAVNPRLDTRGGFLGYVGMSFDITDIRESNARLAASAAERDAILGQLAEGVIVTDPEGRITFINDAARRQHGIEALGTGPDDYAETYQLFTEDGRPYPSEELPLTRAVRNGEIVTGARWRIRRPDGSEVVAVGNARPVIGDDGISIGAVLTMRDETARVQAENLLTESEARFRTVADSAPVFIWMTDPETRITFANKRYQTVFGVDVGELMGARWKKLAHPDDIEPFSKAFIKAMKGHHRFEGMLRIDHKKLGLRWLRCESIPRFDAAGVFRGYVGASLDVTDSKRAADDLKRINELLEERVGEALAEKAKAEADLMHAQRMEAVGRLTGGVAHDFNNLLTVVIGALDIILRSPDDATKRKKLGEAALAAARRGEGLTHQLLAFSRRQTLRPEAVDLNTLIRESEPLLRRAVGEAIEFKLKLRRGGARVSVDPGQFEAALLNLVVNARDALGDKGRVMVQTHSCAVKADEISELVPGDYVCITVSDTGSGMPPEVIARVFEPFFTTKAVGKGTGLGLSQVYGFARQSGGTARISSSVGKGTDIHIYLPPLRDRTQVLAEPTTGLARAMPSGRRLLLVEDDVGVAAVAVELLQALGLIVQAVETAPEALKRLKVERFDVMLSDVVMPGGMTGIELARTCAADYPEMRIILTSGYAGDDVDEALTDAPWPFLRKPYSADQLSRILQDPAPADGGEPPG